MKNQKKPESRTISDITRSIVLRLINMIRSLPGLLMDSCYLFYRNRGNHLAASISFFTILSLIPILLLLSALLGYLTTDPELQKQVLQNIHQIIPTWKQESRRSLLFLQENQRALGLIGLSAMYLTSRSLVASMNFAFDLVLEEERPKSFFRSHLDTIIVLCSLFLLVVLSGLINIGYEFVKTFSLVSKVETYLLYFTPSIGRISGFLISLFVYILFFRVLPSRTLAMSNIVVAAILSALLWEAGKTLFSKYLLEVIERYKMIYGSVSSMIFAVLWAYLYGLSLVFGICFAAAEENRFTSTEESEEEKEEKEEKEELR